MSSMSLTAQQQPQVQASQPPSQMTNEMQQPSLQQQVNGSINGQYDARLTTEPDAIKQEVGGEPTSQQQPGGQQQQHPGVGNAKIKSDEPAKIKRPMNPFMIFGCEKRRKLAQVHPRMHNSEISKILGAEWKRMSDYEKSPYVQEAKRLKEQHSIEYPNYKFKANRRKPRQAIKKEPRAAYPYGSEINSLPAAMKFPYPSPFFQDSIYGTMYPVMPSSHQYSSMYDFARQSMSAGGGGGGALVRSGVAAPTTTAATADYYSLNKTTSPTAGGIDYYGSTLPNKADYYSAGTPGATTRPERTSSAGDVTNLSDRYPTTADSRQFENGRYSASSFATGQTPPGASVPATYSSIQNIPHMDSPATYSSYSTLYEQRH